MPRVNFDWNRRSRRSSQPIVAHYGWLLVLVHCVLDSQCAANGDEPPRWQYAKEQMQPFWNCEIIYRESVLFIRESNDEEATANVLFPIDRVISIEDSSGVFEYDEGSDFHYQQGERKLTVPVNSNIVTRTLGELRRPAGSQKYRLTHRDGSGEIFFGGGLEYHNMQTWITYTKASAEWPVEMPKFDASMLPRTVGKLRSGEPISITLLGDSISTGCNASAWGNGAPFQPAFQDLLKLHLEATYSTAIHLTNLSVDGMATPWGLSQIPKVVEYRPDLIIIAFGMNDASGLTAEEFEINISGMISSVRETTPRVEFILISPMLGNRDWTALNHDRFTEYRDRMAELCQPGIVLADMTSVWNEFQKRKRDCDLTGNGVNHPNDFGHRVYAQVLSSLLVPPNDAAQ